MSLSFHALILVRNGKFGPGIAQTLGDCPGDAAFIGHAKNDRVFSLHTQHNVDLKPV
jgi:hypothetical protein